MTLIEILNEQWDAVRIAPWAFVLVTAAMFLLAFGVIRWRYEGIIESFRERIEALKERLEAKDDQLDEYRERLHLIPARGSEFSRLSHAELKGSAIEFVKSLRAWLAGWSTEDSRLHHREWVAMTSAPTDEEKRRLWNESTGAIMERYVKLTAEYDERFKVDAILLRDEILSRLSAGSRNGAAQSLYEHPTNPIGMSMVADDLERLAKLLG